MLKQKICIGLKMYTIQTPHPPLFSNNDIVLGKNVKQKMSNKFSFWIENQTSS
jgi:hypothetical protein